MAEYTPELQGRLEELDRELEVRCNVPILDPVPYAWLRGPPGHIWLPCCRCCAAVALFIRTFR